MFCAKIQLKLPTWNWTADGILLISKLIVFASSRCDVSRRVQLHPCSPALHWNSVNWIVYAMYYRDKGKIFAIRIAWIKYFRLSIFFPIFSYTNYFCNTFSMIEHHLRNMLGKIKKAGNTKSFSIRCCYKRNNNV